MATFKTGEKVICVDPGRDLGLEKGKIYTIADVTTDSQGSAALMLFEVMPPEPFHNYLAHRFKKPTPEQIKEESNLLTV